MTDKEFSVVEKNRIRKTLETLRWRVEIIRETESYAVNTLSDYDGTIKDLEGCLLED